MARLRAWFADRDFVEVETSVLQVSPGNEAHLHAFGADLTTSEGERHRRYLRTSPEFACKKLLAAGETRIFEFARSFRNRERGALHHPEFTMLEWYRASEGYAAAMDDCAALLALAATCAGTASFRFRGRSADPFVAPERVSVADAFSREAGIDLLSTIGPEEGDRDALAAAATGAGIRLAADDTWSDIFSRVLVEKVEPAIGNTRATILYDYPAIQSALARRKESDPRLAERFEVYACGVELANGFGELTDPLEQRRRLEDEMTLKARLYGERYPLDEDFLEALAAMPQATGVALGFDRLTMLAFGATHIEQVLWTPVDSGE